MEDLRDYTIEKFCIEKFYIDRTFTF